MSEIKTLSGVEIKSESEGRVLARFATYDEIDHHNDVTYKGAFEDGAPIVVSSYNHTSWGGSLPVGKGTIREGKGYAYADLQFFLNTQAGRDTFETVKNLGPLQQWSYGFDVLEDGRDEIEGKSVRTLKKVKVHEVSPVLVGAGKSTATLAVKTGLSVEYMDELADKVAEILKANSKPKPKPKPKDDDEEEDDSKKPSSSKKPVEEDEEEDDEKRPSKRPRNSGKMRMSDQTDEVVTSLRNLADRAEEIVALRKSEGKTDVSAALQEQFFELLKQADRIFALCPQDEDGFLKSPETKTDESDPETKSEVEQIYLSLLSEEL